MGGGGATPAPEPSTSALMLVGLAGLGLAGHRASEEPQQPEDRKSLVPANLLVQVRRRDEAKSLGRGL